MNYVALYRKYRPQNFDEVVGQQHITDTLRNQIMQDKVPKDRKGLIFLHRKAQ